MQRITYRVERIEKRVVEVTIEVSEAELETMYHHQLEARAQDAAAEKWAASKLQISGRADIIDREIIDEANSGKPEVSDATQS